MRFGSYSALSSLAAVSVIAYAQHVSARAARRASSQRLNSARLPHSTSADPAAVLSDGRLPRDVQALDPRHRQLRTGRDAPGWAHDQVRLPRHTPRSRGTSEESPPHHTRKATVAHQRRSPCETSPRPRISPPRSSYCTTTRATPSPRRASRSPSSARSSRRASSRSSPCCSSAKHSTG